MTTGFVLNLEYHRYNLYWESLDTFINPLDAFHEASRLVEEEGFPEIRLRILDPQDKEL